MKEDLLGLPGLVVLTIATGAAGIAWIALGYWLPAVACGAAIAVGWWAVDKVNR